MSEHETPETVGQLVQEVSAWYTQQILAERRSSSPDAGRLETLKAELAACAADQEALRTADPQEAAEIASRYAALSKKLRGQ